MFSCSEEVVRSNPSSSLYGFLLRSIPVAVRAHEEEKERERLDVRPRSKVKKIREIAV